MKNILVTGANGLIGNELIKVLSQQHKVYALSRSNISFNHPNITLIHLDFETDWDSAILPENIDVVYHLAQSENFRDFPEKGKQIFQVNTGSTVKLLDYAKKNNCKKFIYASSGGIYGNSDIGFNEDAPVVPNEDLGFYLSTKFCSEVLVENYSNYFDVTIVRFFFVYGERQRKTMFIPRLIESIKEGKPITLQGKDGIKVNPIYVEDAVKAIIKIMSLTGSHKINIAGPETLALRNICDIISKEVGKEPNYLTEQKEAKHLIGDIKKMKSLLVSPELKLKDVIRKFIK